jgi:cytochrome b6-f complex iron-sulfur subunit
MLLANATPVLIAVPVLVVLAVVAVAASMRRRDAGLATGALSRETRKRDAGAVAPTVAPEAPSGRELERSVALERRGTSTEVEMARSTAPVPFTPPDPETIGVTRRQFFNRSIIAMMGLGLSGFGAACIAFLWPQVKGGFGSKIPVGRISDVQQDIVKANGFLYRADGRMWITAYPAGALEKAKKTYSAPELAGMQAGVIALYQKCPHLGCRVPNCATSQWFECPCHGSQYNRVGEKRGGPAPRGMDRFAMSVDGGFLTVDTGTIIPGPPIGTNTTGQEAEGPHCVGGKAE